MGLRHDGGDAGTGAGMRSLTVTSNRPNTRAAPRLTGPSLASPPHFMTANQRTGAARLRTAPRALLRRAGRSAGRRTGTWLLTGLAPACLALASLLVLPSQAQAQTMVPADWALKPTDVSAGEKFRLFFVSSARRDASSRYARIYNTWIRTRAAAGHTDIQSYSAGFTALVSTGSDDARDNTSTTYTSTDKGVPIYWLNGAKVADDYQDFYDGSWDQQDPGRNENGAVFDFTSGAASHVWTGTGNDGTVAVTGGFLGTEAGLDASSPVYAQPFRIGSHLQSGEDTDAETARKRLYGISAVFQVAAATGSNTDPEFSEDTAMRSVAENTATDQNIGAPVSTTDTDTGDTLEYTLTGADATSFTIDSSTGQLKTKDALDFETDPSYTVIVGVQDNKDSTGGTDSMVDDTITVTISVTNVDEPPAAPAAPTVVAKSGTSDTLSVSWTAAGNAGRPAITDYDVRYCEGSAADCTADGDFTDAVHTGTATTVEIGSLAAETEYQVQVRATNADGMGGWSGSGSGSTGTPPLTVSFESSSGTVDGGVLVLRVLEKAGSNTVTYKVVLSGPPGQEVEVPLTRLGGGTASTSDYSGVPSSVKFGATETEKTLTFTATEDTAAEGIETVTFRFGTLPTGIVGGTATFMTARIVDDDFS